MTRPEFHFTAEVGWINDPHGITYRDGRYHLFYQFVPDGVEWAPNCHWGHAISSDLFSFETLPVAIAPGGGDDGIWTGCLVTDDQDRATIFYTSVTTPGFGVGRVRTATPLDDSWVEWTKGPVVAEAPADLDVVAFRDPFVLREDGPDRSRWRMLVGAALADGTATALSYVSADLEEWSYAGVVAGRSTHDDQPVWTGALWECPQIFELDGRHVLVTSVWDADVLYYAAYAVGELRDGTFTAQTWGRLTFGDVYYAPSLFHDAQGRPCLMFWLRGVEDRDAGWAGAHSIPHIVRLDGDRLVAAPHPRLEARHLPVAGDGVDGLTADVTWVGTRLRLRSGGRDAAVVSIADGELLVSAGDRTHAMPFAGGSVRLVIDGPVLEISTGSGLVAAIIQPGGGELTIDADGDVTALHAVGAA